VICVAGLRLSLGFGSAHPTDEQEMSVVVRVVLLLGNIPVLGRLN
jgi:hypothetical protein